MHRFLAWKWAPTGTRRSQPGNSIYFADLQSGAACENTQVCKFTPRNQSSYCQDQTLPAISSRSTRKESAYASPHGGSETLLPPLTPSLTKQPAHVHAIGLSVLSCLWNGASKDLQASGEDRWWTEMRGALRKAVGTHNSECPTSGRWGQALTLDIDIGEHFLQTHPFLEP